ncbi:MAG: hypothetical protein IPO86_12570 [Saprospiraceae bacterium]|nr:hypothetical protein [Saprospiraceae bacterium]MBK9728941.1 hypothetical protein [Saprospiraceae bacterium]
MIKFFKLRLFALGILHTTSLLLFVNTAMAQAENQIEEQTANYLSYAPEFSIPVSPAFDLLGVNPCLVPKPSNLRNFKVDWSFKSYGLTPNLAIQTQPINEIYFNTPKKLKNYYKRSKFLKQLASLDLSAGTVDGNTELETKSVTFKDIEGIDSIVNIENNWRIRSFSYAVKLNLYKEYEPLNDKLIFRNVMKEYDEKKSDLKTQIGLQKKSLTQTNDQEEKYQIKEAIKSYEMELNGLDNTFIDRMKKIVDLYKAEKWNSSYIDLAFGQAFDYDSRDSSLLKFKNLHKVRTLWGLWINGSKGFGKNVLLSGIARVTSDKNILVNEKFYQLDCGLNFRYGNYRYNFFTEIFMPIHFNQPVLEGNKFIAFGGDWRFSRNVILNYAMRASYDDAGKLENIIPVVSVSCIMR